MAAGTVCKVGNGQGLFRMGCNPAERVGLIVGRRAGVTAGTGGHGKCRYNQKNE